MLQWIKAKVNNWLFYRAMEKAPIKRLGNIFVKEVYGNFYAVDIEDVKAR